MAIVSLGLTIVIWLWPAPRTKFTRAEQERMTSLLKKAPQPHEPIQLGCPDTDDDACLVAGQLVNVFTGAGWDVLGDKVAPVRLGKPAPGITIMRRAEGTGCTIEDTDPEDDWAPEPGSKGRCFRETPSVRAIRAAFASVEVRARRRGDVGGALPEGVLGVFVGPRLFDRQLKE